MDVSAWNNGGGTYGIRIGTGSRQSYFEPGWEQIVIHLDSETASFALTSGFWRHCPEIRDRGRPLIREWLRRHRTVEWPSGKPPRMKLVPLHDNHFELLP